MGKMRYRLALDLGSSSLGWAMVRLKDKQPVAVIKAGVRIFSDGRNPKDGSSLAVTRRVARSMRRRRDRLLKRKSRMSRLLVQYGFFPADISKRKSLERLNPYELRSKGLDKALSPGEFARALFHINQRRGFKSNRKTDKKDNDNSALKNAISSLQQQLDPQALEGKARTVGELLWRRMQSGAGVRARYRERRVEKDDGTVRIDKSYDLYIDRSMIEAEFDAIWNNQAKLNPELFNNKARIALRDCLLYQRQLLPVRPGRCTLLPEHERAPLALPSQQSFRIYQELNHLRLLGEGLRDVPLSRNQRDAVADALERNNKRSFTQIKTLLKLPGTTRFNLEDNKRQDLKGNATSALLGKKDFFGTAWFNFSPVQQDAIVTKLIEEESETSLIEWLCSEYGIDEIRAGNIAKANMAVGYGSLSTNALYRILPILKNDVITYDKAVLIAGFEHHSRIDHAATTGEILPALPYYGEYLQRHVGFGTGDRQDSLEKRFGKISNPTVHIGLNQVRTVVNALIKRYGHPSEVIVEVARELKQNYEQRKEQHKRQAFNQKRNERLRSEAATLLGIAESHVRQADIQKLLLWEELSYDPAERRCPYSGKQISAAMVLSKEVEIEHILPFSITLDDSLNNKTLAIRLANRIKGNRTPFEARSDFERQGWSYDSIKARAELMPRSKRYRFAEDGYQKWLREDKDFLSRALNDTRYLSRVAREYLSLICPQTTRVIPGQMTAMLRGRFGLNDILGLSGEKNRNDHRHHAVDACVIAVTDQSMLQSFARASASAREYQLGRLVGDMPFPWASYRHHVARAVSHIKVSHKPDHSHEGPMMEATAYGIRKDGSIRQKINTDGKPGREIKNLIRISEPKQAQRHGVDSEGNPLPYVGYVGGNNYCIEIIRDAMGKWRGEVVSTFDAYQAVRQYGTQRLRHPSLSLSGQPLVMRLMINDTVRMKVDENDQIMRVVKMAGSGQIWFAPIHEANVDARNRDKSDPFAYTSKTAGSLRAAQARRVTISPIGEIRDPGFRE